MYLYQKIYNDLLFQIESGTLAKDSRLPSSQKLAKIYGVSIITVHRALEELKRNNFVEQRKGKGTTVCKQSTTHGDVRSAEKKYIAAVLPAKPVSYAPELISALEQAASQRKLPLLFFFTTSLVSERETLTKLLTENIYGILLMTDFMAENLDILSELTIRDVGIVFLGQNVQGIKKPRVRPNDFNGIYEAMESLFRKRHFKIAFYASEKALTENLDRFNGYCQALIDKKIPVNNDYIYTYPQQPVEWKKDLSSSYEQKCAVDALRHFIALSNPPTAIVCIDDFSAYSVLLAAQSMGIQIPEKFSLVGYGNSPVSQRYQLTSVAPDWKKTAQHAIESILHQYYKRKLESPIDIQIAPSIKHRNSVKINL